MARLNGISATRLNLDRIGYTDDDGKPLWIAMRNGLYERELADYKRLSEAASVQWVEPEPPADATPEQLAAHQAERDAARAKWDTETDAAFDGLLALISVASNITEDHDGNPLPKPTDPAFWRAMPMDVRDICWNWYLVRRREYVRTLGGDAELFTISSSRR